jgi:hypothetical protein
MTDTTGCPSKSANTALLWWTVLFSASSGAFMDGWMDGWLACLPAALALWV